MVLLFIYLFILLLFPLFFFEFFKILSGLDVYWVFSDFSVLGMLKLMHSFVIVYSVQIS